MQSKTLCEIIPDIFPPFPFVSQTELELWNMDALEQEKRDKQRGARKNN